EREAARRRLELERARLEILKQLQGFSASLASGAPMDLSQQIDALEQSVPELRGRLATAESAAAPAVDTGSRTWGLVNRLIRLRQSRTSVDELSASTAALSRSVTADTRAIGEELRALGTRLSTLAENPDAAPAADGDRAGVRGGGHRLRAAERDPRAGGLLRDVVTRRHPRRRPREPAGPLRVRQRRSRGDRVRPHPAARARRRSAEADGTHRRLPELRRLHRDLLQASYRRRRAAAQALSIAFASRRAPS